MKNSIIVVSIILIIAIVVMAFGGLAGNRINLPDSPLDSSEPLDYIKPEDVQSPFINLPPDQLEMVPFMRTSGDDSNGSTTLDVVFMNLIDRLGEDELVFQVYMNTHTLDLDKFSIDQLSTIENILGVERISLFT